MPVRTAVKLHLYDLSNGMARSMSLAIIGKQLDGIWHSGIAVFGVEYFYGGGICAAPAGRAIPHLPYQEIHLGETTKSQIELETFLQSVNTRYTQATYSLLRHNCNNFANEVSNFLLNGAGIPEHIIRLPQEFLSSPLGGTLAPMIEQMENRMRSEILGGGNGLNPFAHIQGRSLLFDNPTASSITDPPTGGSELTAMKMENDMTLLKTAVDGIPVTIMSEDVKKKIICLDDESVIPDLVDIIQKNFNPSKNPVLMSFGTIARFFVKYHSFRQRLTPVLADLVEGCMKATSVHVVNTGMSVLVNFTAGMSEEDFAVIAPVVKRGVLPVVESLLTSPAQKRMMLMVRHNVLMNGCVDDILFAECFLASVKILFDHKSIIDQEQVKRLAKLVENASIKILEKKKHEIEFTTLDLSDVVVMAEEIEQKHRIRLEKMLLLLLD